MAVTVGIRELRNNLRVYLQQVQGGDDVVVTDRGRPIARITQSNERSKRDELIARGVITPAAKPGPWVRARNLPTPTVPLSEEISRLRGAD